MSTRYSDTHPPGGSRADARGVQSPGTHPGHPQISPGTIGLIISPCRRHPFGQGEALRKKSPASDNGTALMDAKIG
ncbi:MAG: hypothetical protein WD597_05480, partial [Balneolaceae bacterium]